jgi:hypothetical protein
MKWLPFSQTFIPFFDPRLLLGHLAVVEHPRICSGIQAKFKILVAMFGWLSLPLEGCLSLTN